MDDKNTEDEKMIKLMQDRFRGKAVHYSGPMKSISKDSILNAPVFDDGHGNCVVQESANKWTP